MTRYRNALWAGMSFVAISLGVPPGVFARLAKSDVRRRESRDGHDRGYRMKKTC